MTERAARTPGRPEASPLRVLHVINQLGPGGAERSLGDLVVPLAAEGVRVSIACVHPIAPEYRRDFVPDCPVRSLTRRTLPGKALELRRLLAKDRPDLVHTTLFESHLVGRLAVAGLGIPLVSSLVNTEYEPVRRQDPNVGAARLAAVRALDRWSGRLFTRRYHAITEAVARSAERTLGIRRRSITVVPRGRDPARFKPPDAGRRRRARSALGLASDAEVLVNVGRHEFQKGHEHLLRATAILARSRPRLRVVVAGRRGNTSPALDRLHRELGLGEALRFLGSRTDVAEVLAAGDLFVFPSLYEGLGGAVIEAMALGLPVVASDLPALHEVVEPGGNALLVPAGDPPALARAIESLLDDRETARRFGHRSREIFRERFTIDVSAAGLARFYRSVLEDEGSEPR